MKKSLSSPSLVGLGRQAAPHSPLPSSKMGKSKSINAIPELMGVAFDVFQKEIQAEAVFHVPALQAGKCGIGMAKFPYEVLMREENGEPLGKEEKALVECLLEPNDREDAPVHRPWGRALQGLSYLDLSEHNPQISQRYAELLRRVRRRKPA